MEKTALVTGGTGGIGQAIVRRLCQDGYHVMIGYYSQREEAQALAREVDGSTVYLDLSSREGIRVAVQTISAYAIDVLVNNAGVSLVGLLQEQSEEDIYRTLSVDLEGAIMLTRAALKHMLSVHSGRIINIASIWGVTGGACEVVYSSAKAGLLGFTRALAKEVGQSEIMVNAVAPGVIDTAMNAHLTTTDRRNLVAETPLGRLGRAEDVANAVAYLISADFVTGQCLTVDGGFL